MRSNMGLVVFPLSIQMGADPGPIPGAQDTGGAGSSTHLNRQQFGGFIGFIGLIPGNGMKTAEIRTTTFTLLTTYRHI